MTVPALPLPTVCARLRAVCTAAHRNKGCLRWPHYHRTTPTGASLRLIGLPLCRPLSMGPAARPHLAATTADRRGYRRPRKSPRSTDRASRLQSGQRTEPRSSASVHKNGWSSISSSFSERLKSKFGYRRDQLPLVLISSRDFRVRPRAAVPSSHRNQSLDGVTNPKRTNQPPPEKTSMPT